MCCNDNRSHTGIETNPAGSGLPATQQLNVAAVQASASLLNFYPTPNGSPLLSNGCSTGAQFAITEPLTKINDTFGLGRVDYQLTQNQSLFARYLIQTGTQIEYKADPLSQFAQDIPLSTEIFTMGHRYPFGSGWLNQFTVSFDRAGYNIGLTPNPSITSLPSALALFPGYTSLSQIGSVSTTGGVWARLTGMAIPLSSTMSIGRFLNLTIRSVKTWANTSYRQASRFNALFHSKGRVSTGTVCSILLQYWRSPRARQIY